MREIHSVTGYGDPAERTTWHHEVRDWALGLVAAGWFAGCFWFGYWVAGI